MSRNPGGDSDEFSPFESLDKWNCRDLDRLCEKWQSSKDSDLKVVGSQGQSEGCQESAGYDTPETQGGHALKSHPAKAGIDIIIRDGGLGSE